LAKSDTLRTHIRGILSRHPEWATDLASFEAEAAWIIGDWQTVERVADGGHPMARVMTALHQKELGTTLAEARVSIGQQITSTQYNRVYEPVLQLHILRELEEIEAASKVKHLRDMHHRLDERFDSAATAFRTRETILSARRTAFSVLRSSLQPEIGKAWIVSSKMARKAGYDQTAYSAVLQAREIDAPFAFVQQAKLSRANGALKALTELENSLSLLVLDADSDTERFARDRNMAKVSADCLKLIQAVQLQARWMHESDRFEPNQIIVKFNQAIQLAQE
jgi:serine/threonine-protein kinase ATR